MRPMIIDDDLEQINDPVIDGEQKSRGLVPRDYGTHPSGCHAAAPQFPTELLITETEWQSRLDTQLNNGSLFDLREAQYDVLKSLNQDGLGLCWAFSTTKAVMYLRALMNQPAVRLSAWWVAGKVKGWRDQGGWGGESVEEVASGGVPEESFCPSYRSSFDTAETRANAAKHKITEWWDGTESRDMNRRIMISCFLMGLPPVLDFNDISHSMCGCRLVSLNPLTIDCDNSWGESAGVKGIYRRTGSGAIPDGLVIPRVTMAA